MKSVSYTMPELYANAVLLTADSREAIEGMGKEEQKRLADALRLDFRLNGLGLVHKLARLASAAVYQDADGEHVSALIRQVSVYGHETVREISGALKNQSDTANFRMLLARRKCDGRPCGPDGMPYHVNSLSFKNHVCALLRVQPIEGPQQVAVAPTKPPLMSAAQDAKPKVVVGAQKTEVSEAEQRKANIQEAKLKLERGRQAVIQKQIEEEELLAVNKQLDQLGIPMATGMAQMQQAPVLQEFTTQPELDENITVKRMSHGSSSLSFRSYCLLLFCLPCLVFGGWRLLFFYHQYSVATITDLTGVSCSSPFNTEFADPPVHVDEPAILTPWDLHMIGSLDETDLIMSVSSGSFSDLEKDVALWCQRPRSGIHHKLCWGAVLGLTQTGLHPDRQQHDASEWAAARGATLVRFDPPVKGLLDASTRAEFNTIIKDTEDWLMYGVGAEKVDQVARWMKSPNRGRVIAVFDGGGGRGGNWHR